ncbi:MAG: hypothetical protein Q4G04_02215 [bacterium]|nr:hypothetical protein [bacterium]
MGNSSLINHLMQLSGAKVSTLHNKIFALLDTLQNPNENVDNISNMNIYKSKIAINEINDFSVLIVIRDILRLSISLYREQNIKPKIDLLKNIIFDIADIHKNINIGDKDEETLTLFEKVYNSTLTDDQAKEFLRSYWSNKLDLRESIKQVDTAVKMQEVMKIVAALDTLKYWSEFKSRTQIKPVDVTELKTNKLKRNFFKK